jgi:hypothetical protein
MAENLGSGPRIKLRTCLIARERDEPRCKAIVKECALGFWCVANADRAIESVLKLVFCKELCAYAAQTFAEATGKVRP